jgi:23S rRNA pseudouridine2605 synthase
MRINQFIAGSTDLSRRAADAAVAAGRVSINGHTAAMGQLVDARDSVMLDGTALALRQIHTYVLLNKPAGYVSSRVRQGTGPTLYELLPPLYKTLRIAGRLDRDSSGLVVLTDDGDFIFQLTHPSAEKSKRYELTLQSPLSAADQRKLEAGVVLADGPSQVHVLETRGRSLTVTLSEGRNRQLRRTLGALGYTITKLHRVSMGSLELGALAPGKWHEIDREGKEMAV